MNVVLINELKRYNILLNLIQDSLNDIKLVTKGKLVMSSALESVFNSLAIGKVPDMWSSKSYPSLKLLGNYINDLCERLKFFKVLD